MKSAFSPLCPPGAFGPASRYPFLQHPSSQAKRFLAAPYSGTGYLSTILQEQSDQTDANGNTSNGESQD